MWPSYHLHTPDSLSGLGSKYRLYLYRENPPRTEHKRLENARPAVFVHGNAGSYGQVRSVASYSWLQHQAHIKAGGKDPEIDWWSVDFNEDFSAFHAATLEQQSVYLNEVLAYLLTLYPHLGQAEDVPILAHSMGGVVARLALLQDNHPTPPRIRTLVTLSTPHALPPAPIEAGLQDIYNLINTPHDRGEQLAIVSLSGGVLDTQLPSEYALLPPALASNALHLYTTDLPTLWSSVDHLAMMWCDQLRRKIVNGFTASSSAVTTQDKLTIWKQVLQNADAADPVQFERFMTQSPVVQLNITDGTLHEYPISGQNDAAEHFRVITSHRPADFDVFVCRQDACSPLPHVAFATIPASPASSNFQQWRSFPQAETHYDSSSGREDVWRELRLNATHLRSHGWTSIRISAPLSQQLRWWRAGWTASGSQQSPVRTLRFPYVDSSLAQYSMTIHNKCREQQARIAPMAHVYNPLTGDGRWYPSLSFDNEGKTTLPVYLHSTSPFLELPHGAMATKGLTVDVYYDSQACPSAIDNIAVNVDLLRSMGHLVSRYRVGLVAWPIVPWSFARLAATSSKQPSHVSTLILALPPALAGVQALVGSLYPELVVDALFGLVQNSLRPFGWTLSDWFVTTALIYAALALGMVVFGLWMSLLTIGTYVCDYAARAIPLSKRVLRFDHVDPQMTSNSKPKFRNSTIASIFILLLLVRLAIPYQFVVLVLTMMQLLNVVRSKIAGPSSTKTPNRLEQNMQLATHLLLLLPLCAPALLVFVRNFIAAVQSSQSTIAHVGAGHAFRSAYSQDHNVFKILPILLLVQILSTGRVVQTSSHVTGPKSTLAARVFSRIPTLIQVAYAVLALYALVYGIRHPYRLYDLSLVVFSLQAAGHYACRWGLVSMAEDRAGGLRREDGRVGENHERLPMSVRRSNEEYDEEEDVTRRLLPRNDDAPARSPGAAAAAVAFSIPSSLMEDGVESSAVEPIAAAQITTATNSSQDQDKGAEPLVPTSDTLTDLLTAYLTTLDAYTAQQQNLSTAFSRAFFALSTDRMASGGWGSNVRKELANARLHRELQVVLSVSSDADSDGKAETVGSKLESVPLPFLDDDDEQKAEAVLMGADEKKMMQASSGDQTLRQRRKGQHDEKQSNSDTVDDLDEKKTSSSSDSSPSPRPRRHHPSALQQYSALPSANLRKAQSSFKDALGVIADDAPAAASLVHLRLSLVHLENEIRRARKEKESERGGSNESEQEAEAYSI